MAGDLRCLCLILTLHVLTITGDTVDCGSNWFSFNKNCYHMSSRRASWTTAQGECSILGSKLLKIDSKDELVWLKKILVTNPSSGYWTALNDNPLSDAGRLGNGVWTWGNHEDADMSVISWEQHPVNDGQTNCAGFDNTGRLVDLDCMSRQGYICQKKSNTGCPLGWLITDTKCLLLSDVSDASMVVTWDRANTLCVSSTEGASLLTIDNQEDAAFLHSELPYLTKSAVTYWTGYTYNSTWNLSRATTPLIQWRVEPSNVAGIENCAIMRMSGGFNTRNCSLDANFICKKPQATYAPTDDIGCGTWLRAGRFCYKIFRDDRASWKTARDSCQIIGSDLIKVDSYDKKFWLQHQMMDPLNSHVYWTGLKVLHTSNGTESNGTNYVWADNTPFNATYITWNQELGNGNCAVIFNNGQYNDITCDFHAAAICEMNTLSDCPLGWVARGYNCYLFTPFNNETVLFSQPEAAAYCATFTASRSIVSGLLSVNDLKEKAFIKKQLAGMPENIYGYYTSLTDKGTEGWWKFSNGNMDASLVDWVGEPSVYPGDACGLVIWGGAHHMRNCSTPIGYICEKLATGFS